jgi:hypothetical protein
MFQACGGLFDSFDSLHYHPLLGHFPPPIVGTPSSFWASLRVSSSFYSKWRGRTSNYSHVMTSTLSPIGCLGSHIWLPAAWLRTFLLPSGLGLICNVNNCRSDLHLQRARDYWVQRKERGMAAWVGMGGGAYGSLIECKQCVKLKNTIILRCMILFLKKKCCKQCLFSKGA